jgi:hypothetical protein
MTSMPSSAAARPFSYPPSLFSINPYVRQRPFFVQGGGTDTRCGRVWFWLQGWILFRFVWWPFRSYARLEADGIDISDEKLGFLEQGAPAPFCVLKPPIPQDWNRLRNFS